MTKEEMVQLLKTDIQGWNQWRKAHPESMPDLSGVDLQHSLLESVNLNGANLRGADLSDCSLIFAQMIKADLRDSQLSSADLSAASLGQADFRGANLVLTNLYAANVNGARFEGATMDATLLSGINLSEAEGLDEAKLSGPVRIDIETVYVSHGKISEVFLRKANVPEEFIQFMRSIVRAKEGIQFYSCFISHSHKDEEFAHRLCAKLEEAKLRVWYAPEDMKGGQKLHDQIETAIRIHDKLLLVLSEASLQSEWVKTEIRNARRLERKTGKKKLFPVRLVDMEAIKEWSEFDADSGKDMGVELREYYIPDFSQWKDHDRFEVEFKKLLRDLKADAPLIQPT